MRVLGLLAASAAVCALASTATAGPLAGSAVKGLTESNLVLPVHGCHREVLLDRYGWHYHRHNCRRVDVPPPPEYNPYGPYGPGPYGPGGPCFWVGPVRVCP